MTNVFFVIWKLMSTFVFKPTKTIDYDNIRIERRSFTQPKYPCRK